MLKFPAHSRHSVGMQGAIRGFNKREFVVRDVYFANFEPTPGVSALQAVTMLKTPKTFCVCS